MRMVNRHVQQPSILTSNHPTTGHVSPLMESVHPAEVENHLPLPRHAVLYSTGMLANVSSMLGTVHELARGGEQLQLVPHVDGGLAYLYGGQCGMGGGQLYRAAGGGGGEVVGVAAGGDGVVAVAQLTLRQLAGSITTLTVA